jgi:hypothetical protein
MRKSCLYLFGCLLFLMGIMVTSCKKEYSIEGGSQAKYIISGSPTTCAPAVVSGFYIEGKQADVTNTLQLNVDVTLAGNYTIFTTPVNGISFTSSGTFADTGMHVVTLQCTGTPTVAGTFSIQIPGDNGCSFTLIVLKKAPAGYVLSGDPNDCAGVISHSTFVEGKAFTSNDTLTLQVVVSMPGTYTIATNTVNGVSFSGSGTFSTTGTQTVTLRGSGTPDATGFFFFNVQAGSSQCSFSVRVQNADPVATYVLQSGMQNGLDYCTPQSVQGDYTAGIALNNSNSITVSPYVTVKGSYTISTYKINGMIFSASGTFTAPGNYSIPLQGSGTPLVVGTFTVTPFIIGPAPIGGSSCSVDINVK